MENINIVYDYIFMSNYFEPFVTFEIRQDKETGKNELYFIYANKYLPNITGVPNEQIINKSFHEVYFNKCNTIFDWETIIIEAAMTSSFKIIEEYFEFFNKFLKLFIFGYNNGIFHVIIKDISEHKENKRILFEKNRQIDYLVEEVRIKNNNDNLTKLYNYQFGLSCIDLSISDYNQSGTNFTVLLLDLLGLKYINAKYGFKDADDILIDISDIIISNTRKIDVACRYFGGKFLIIYNNVNSDIAKVLIDKLKFSIKKNVFVNSFEEVYINGASADYSGQQKTDFIFELENNLTKAKALGKDVIL